MERRPSVEAGSCSKRHCGPDRTGLREWNPKHKIFLSHSRKQKEFVRQLAKDLEAETHQPFFDEGSYSLPKGERFAPLIFQAARQCRVAVVVLSESFLTSEWPMLELVEFVKAKRSVNPELKLFPLFYKLSPADLKRECIENRWKAAWSKNLTLVPDEVLPLDDTRSRLSLNLCVEALSELRGASGLEFAKFSSKVSYREAIVKEISLLVAPALLDDTSDVVGNERLCTLLSGMFVEDTSEDSDLCGTSKLGLYGMGGLGKTTMSRALCMFYHQMFHGRVFHVELGSMPPLDLQKLVLTELLRLQKDIVERVRTEHQGRQLLKAHMKRQAVFLAIDNITDEESSKSQARVFLESGFHSGSKILITSRSSAVVEEFFPSHRNAEFCKGVANLSEEEARLIFLRRGAPRRKLETLTNEEREILDECVAQCRFPVEEGEGQYHPLALQALADYYHEIALPDVLSWKDHLGDADKLKVSHLSSNIFGILGLQFQTLAVKEKKLFLYLCLYILGAEGYWPPAYSGCLSQLVDVQKDRQAVVERQLQRLKRLGIIDIADVVGELFITIHDLYKEFAKWYVLDGDGGRWCVYCEPLVRSVDSLPDALMRTDPLAFEVAFIKMDGLNLATFPSKKFREWCNVVVLQIYCCSNLKVLDLHGLSCLRRLELVCLRELESVHFAELQVNGGKKFDGGLESLQHVELNNLPSLNELPDFSMCTLLKTFEMLYCGDLLLEPPRIRGCSQLEKLVLGWNFEWQVEEFQLNTLTSLTSLEIRDCLSSRDVSGSLTISQFPLPSLVDFFLPLMSDMFCDGSDVGDSELHGNSTQFQLLSLGDCYWLQELALQDLLVTSLFGLGLEKLTKLRKLVVHNCHSLEYFPDVSALAELEELSIWGGRFEQIPGLERLQRLQILTLRSNSELTWLPDLDHLPNLSYVDVGGSKDPNVPPNCLII